MPGMIDRDWTNGVEPKYKTKQPTPDRTVDSPWQRWPRDWEDMGNLERVFSVLWRGKHASANVVWGILQGDSNLAQRAWDGLLGRERGDFIDILRHYDIPWAPVWGTALNIGLDPLKAVGGPIGIAKSGIKTLGKAPGVQEGVKAVKNLGITEHLGQMFKYDYKVPKEASELLDQLQYEWQTEKAKVWRTMMEKYSDVKDPAGLKKLTDWRLKGNIPEGASTEMTQYYYDMMDWWDKATLLAKKSGAITDAAIEAHTEKGISTYLPSPGKGMVKYYRPGESILGATKKPAFSHTEKLTREKKQAISDAFKHLTKYDSKSKIKSVAQDMVRKSDTLDHHFLDRVDVANKRWTLRGVKSHLNISALEYEPVERMDALQAMYLENLKGIQYKHKAGDVLTGVGIKGGDAWAHGRSIGEAVTPGHELLLHKRELQEVVNSLGKEGLGEAFKPATTILGKSPILDDLVPVTKNQADLLQKAAVQADLSVYEVMDEVIQKGTRVQDFFSGGTETSNIAKWYDSTIGKWKRWATIYRLPFHARNFISNTARMYMAGMDMPDIAKELKKVSAMKLHPEAKFTVGDTTKTGREWMDFWSAHGVRGFGWLDEVMGQDHARELAKMVEGKGSTLRDIAQKPTEVATGLGRFIEDVARIGLADWKLEQGVKAGLSFNEAAKSGMRESWKHLFQYDQLTEFEKTFMKRLIPFYTWMRKNIPLQVENLIKEPERFRRVSEYANAMRYISPETERETELKPDYLNEVFAFKLPQGIQEWWSKAHGAKVADDTYAWLDLPWSDLNRFPDRFPRGIDDFRDILMEVVPSLTPALSIPFTEVTGVQPFPVPHRVERFEGELVPAPWPIVAMQTGEWPVLGITPIRDPDSGKRIMGMPARVRNLLEDTIPPIRELSNLFPQAKIEIEEDPPWNRLRFLTGIRFTPVDRADQRKYERAEKKGRLGDIARRMSMLGRPLTSEELDEYFD